jgi:murein DD-endopeptidase MepM/ murein hydrolase activator NlpD
MPAKKYTLLYIAISFFSCCYAQQKTDLIDLIIQSYDSNYALDDSIAIGIPVSIDVKCPPEPNNFDDYFRTDFIDFQSMREAGVQNFSFNDSLHAPLKQNLIITSGYGMRGDRMHFGIDLRVAIGDTICSVFCGKVRIAKYDETYGYVVVIRHYNMGETVYAHLSKILVDINQEVKVGEPIGLGGNTGRSIGAHLHFELRYKGFPINPVVDSKFLKHFPVH